MKSTLRGIFLTLLTAALPVRVAGAKGK